MLLFIICCCGSIILLLKYYLKIHIINNGVVVPNNDDNILVDETVNADKTEILSDVILLHVKSYAPFDDNVNESI